ncbi:MAG TPA: hypothetical protein VE010_03155 [Thermoanaerobaculia bacterium]|nr:hypothetical protein [Thermoanaerobaculia bacterium]
MADIDQKQYIERAIVRARDGVGDRIDELDRHLRTNLDPKTLARSYAPYLVGGGAVLGVVVGFGLPKILRKAVTWGVPLAILALTIKNAREAKDENLVGIS